VRTAVHGMPQIGKGSALKCALESFWAGPILDGEVVGTGVAMLTDPPHRRFDGPAGNEPDDRERLPVEEWRLLGQALADISRRS
jgi:hypothetical protein